MEPKSATVEMKDFIHEKSSQQERGNSDSSFQSAANGHRHHRTHTKHHLFGHHGNKISVAMEPEIHFHDNQTKHMQQLWLLIKKDDVDSFRQIYQGIDQETKKCILTGKVPETATEFTQVFDSDEKSDLMHHVAGIGSEPEGDQTTVRDSKKKRKPHPLDDITSPVLLAISFSAFKIMR